MDAILAVTTIGFGIAVLAVAMPTLKPDANASANDSPPMKSPPANGAPANGNPANGAPIKSPSANGTQANGAPENGNISCQLDKDTVSVIFVQGVYPPELQRGAADIKVAKARLAEAYNTSDVEWITDESRYQKNFETRRKDVEDKASPLSALEEPDGVPSLVEKVSEKLAQNKKVVLIGHSYGSVSAMFVATRLSKSSAVVPNLLVVTLAGIMVEKLPYVQTLHFMIQGDVILTKAFTSQPTTIELINNDQPPQNSDEANAVHFAYFESPYDTDIAGRVCNEIQSMPYSAQPAPV